MNLNSRLGKPDKGPEEPTGEEAVLLALVVSVMSVVTNEVAKELAAAEAETQPAPLPQNHPLSLLPGPCRELSPEQVVKIQLSALKLNDDTHAGIRKVYEFISAGNQEAAPVDAFVEMMQTPLFQPLLNFQAVEFGRIVRGPEYAEQTVTVAPANGGTPISYLVALTRETFGERAGCWLVDSISKA